MARKGRTGAHQSGSPAQRAEKFRKYDPDTHFTDEQLATQGPVKIVAVPNGEYAIAFEGTPEQIVHLGPEGERANIEAHAAKNPHNRKMLFAVHPNNARTMVANTINLFETHTDPTVLVLAESICVLEQHVLDGGVRLHYDENTNMWGWRIFLEDNITEKLENAAEKLAHTTRSQWLNYGAAQQILGFVVDTVYFSTVDHLPLPKAVAACPNPDAVEQMWGERSWHRSLSKGAALVISLVPAENGEPWKATACAEVDGVLYDLHSVCTHTTGLDYETSYTVHNLVETEIRAAKLVQNVPSLFSRGQTELSGKRLDTFCSAVPGWTRAGLSVRMPKGTFTKAVLSTKVSVTGCPTGMLSGGLELHVTSDMNGRILSAEDIDTLACSQQPLVKLGDEWVRVPDNISAAHMITQREKGGNLDAVELLDEEFDNVDMDVEEVTGWVGEALRGIPPLHTAKPVEVPSGLRGELRHYQKDGLTWLNWCEENNVGGILADSMGLGKTIQLLAMVEKDHSGPTLVICPTTLIDNWEAEAAKFTPELYVGIFHGPGRNLDELADADIVLSTYTLLGSDSSLLEKQWHRVILDEAQAIKNPSTKAAQAARKLRATHRFAVTGTPVENHLGDLWSIMSFAQPGLLGSFAKFKRRYVTSDDDGRVERLRHLIAPFLLRRSKTDRTVIDDLPEKVENKHHCGLSREQVGLYEATVKTLTTNAEQADDTRRRGLILGGLTKLKQTCVHPSLAQGTHKDGITATSGKLEELVGIIRAAREENEAVVVFSQFASFLAPLAKFVHTHAEVDVLTLDGSMSRAKRASIVEAFSAADGPPVLLASLKAGGVGLNLVRANHVVHLDRWWNPAVEDQGSDRAWRIGQVRNVMVHTLVCTGTLEDRIDALLEHKRGEAAEVVDGRAVSKAVTEMNAKELKELVKFAKNEHDHMQKVVKKDREGTR